jgi:hypothetical protein
MVKPKTLPLNFIKKRAGLIFQGKIPPILAFSFSLPGAVI